MRRQQLFTSPLGAPSFQQPAFVLPTYPLSATNDQQDNAQNSTACEGEALYSNILRNAAYSLPYSPNRPDWTSAGSLFSFGETTNQEVIDLSGNDGDEDASSEGVTQDGREAGLFARYQHMLYTKGDMTEMATIVDVHSDAGMQQQFYTINFKGEHEIQTIGMNLFSQPEDERNEVAQHELEARALATTSVVVLGLAEKVVVMVSVTRVASTAAVEQQAVAAA